MSAAPFDVQLIIDRLRAAMPGLRMVAGAADYAAIKSLQDFPVPCAYVVLMGEQSEPNPPGHGQRGAQVKAGQRVVVSFGVVLAVRNYREQRGGQVNQTLIDVLAEVRGALLGFVPATAGARPCMFRNGKLSDYDAGTALWMDVWQTQHFITSEASTP
ncbi:phage tail terminator protein [Rhodanobacter lindaniclasticus]